MKIYKATFKQVTIICERSLPLLLRKVADYLEDNNIVSVWELLIDAEPDEDGLVAARIIIAGFVDNMTTESEMQ